MGEAYIVGLGQTPVSKDAGDTPVNLVVKAIREAISNSGLDDDVIDALYVGNMMSGMLSNQAQLGPIVADHLGLEGVEAYAIDAACASGGSALRMAYLTVSGGFHRAAIASGVEVMNHVSRERITQALATGSDWEKEGSKGESFISLNAQLMKNYMEKYKVTSGDFAHFSINAHANAYTNPNAMLHKKMDKESYEAAKVLKAPIKLSDSPPVSDGAASVLVVNKDLAKQVERIGLPVIKIVASAVATDRLASTDRYRGLELRASKVSCQKGYDQARCTPSDIDFFELHDAYTIITSLSLEAAGFAKPGEGVFFGRDGEVTLGGKLPISTMGGLKARGHPVGATGLYQTVEACMQLSNRAGDNQIDDCHLGMTQSIGGTGATVVTHILQGP